MVAVITHVANPHRDRDLTVVWLERTLDGLLESLCHTRLELVLNTLPGRHVANDLPEHLRSRLVVSEHGGADPIFVGFEA